MTDSPTARLLATMIDESGLTQREIAERAGFKKPNILTMLKQGSTKVPIERIPALAAACGMPALPLLETAMTEYAPAAWQTIRKVTGAPLGEDERVLLRAYRAGLAGRPAAVASHYEESLRRLFSTLAALMTQDHTDGDDA